MADHPISPILAEIRAAHSEAARVRLLALRHRLGMTQPQFAEAIGLSTITVKKYEAGNIAADLARAEAAERLFGETA